MIRKILLAFGLILLLLTAYITWNLAGPATSFKGNRYVLYVPTGGTYDGVLDSLETHRVIRNAFWFRRVASWMEYPGQVKAGRYEIPRGINLLRLVRKLVKGRQDPVRLVINKWRTQQDMARAVGRALEPDSLEMARFLATEDSLRALGVDSHSVMTLVIPNTYEFYWNTGVSRFFRRMKQERDAFWNKTRLQQARSLGLTPLQVYTVASIVEEETNKQDEKGTMASVYINRVRKGMRLQADPTIKFSLKDFTIRRITLKHIGEAESPYNTYKVSGLPPGPICTPSIRTIDAVLQSPQTDFLFFCARADLSGYHAFAKTDVEHLQNARAYQRALDSLRIK